METRVPKKTPSFIYIFIFVLFGLLHVFLILLQTNPSCFFFLFFFTIQVLELLRPGYTNPTSSQLLFAAVTMHIHLICVTLMTRITH